MPLACIVHGGAWNIPEDQWEAHRRGCERAAEQGWAALTRGASAIEAVEAAIVVLEDDPTFDSAVGSVLNREGAVELDAGIMDGATLDVGACAAVTRVKNPIRLARALLRGEDNLLVALGGDRYAETIGLELVAPEAFITERERARWKEFLVNPPPPSGSKTDTVGCVAVDRYGSVCAGTSTGGRDFKLPGRVGDSPLVGCGYYADNQAGGASLTGWGESIMRLVLAKWAVDQLACGADPQTVTRAAIEHLAERVNGNGGIILADRFGRVADAHNTSAMARAWITEETGRVISKIQD